MREALTLPNGAVIQGRDGERYIVLGLLGKGGGSSAVYLAENRRNKAQVFAIKEFVNPDSRERGHLAFEAALLTRLHHPSLPRVYNVFENVKLQRVYMVMDYIAGKNMEELRLEQPEHRFPPPLALALMTPVVKAISYLHTQSPPIVHRDIKPANMIVPEGAGETILVDFGIAKEYVEEKTTNAFRFGTPGYAAPEQYGHGTNPRTDIYALAATFYTLVTGKVPVDALIRSVNILHADQLKPAHLLCPEISTSISAVLARAMRLASQDRYPSVDEFWQDLSYAVAHPAEPPPPGALVEMPVPVPAKDQDERKPVSAVVAHRQGLVAPPAKKSRSGLRSSRRSAIVLILLILLVLLLMSGGMLLPFFLVHPNATAPIVHQQKPHVTPTIQLSGCSLPSFVPSAPVSPLYIQAAPAYMGKISNNVADASTKDNGVLLCLADVHQHGDQISGKFSGLGFISTFEGTVTQDHVRFRVPISNDRIYAFDGGIEAGGSMAGTYQVVGVDGQNLGDGGTWEVVPVQHSM